ncbi:unnamed protein product [Candidula unifasciata]|uniref:GH18 domain-containing protein n=1 Tax=Candidula unifasciata TaxID=100452 RepID=A0A8S3ZKX8_9EUPU|nr:unnamed protein product [Candidula unifasciata]
MDSFVLHFKALKKLRGNDKKVASSPYHSQLAKTKQNLAGSQDAPDDATSGHLTSHPRGKPKKPIFCYFGSSANSRPSIGKFWPEHIDPFLCTHLVFAFVDITEDGTGLRPNNWNDLGEKGLYARTMKLKEKNPDLKILLAAGGWKIGSKPFLPVIKNEETWKTWVSHVIVYLRKYNFDGFDMDWEFPTWRGSGPEDKQKFTLLMKELYEKFAEEATYSGKERLLLTLATASSAFYAEKSYEQYEIHKYIDYMLLMTYNFHGSGWEKHTGHHSPLLPHPLDPEGEQRELYILWAVKYWLNFGVPKEKIILGLSTYGLGWKLTDISQTGVKAAANGGSSKGKYTDESGILSLYEICENVLNDDWKVQWIEEQKVPYAYGGGEWVGFDSPDSFYLKAAVIMKEDLGGAFVWSVEMDDFNGHCGGPKYPLLRTIYEVFTQSSDVSSFDSVKSAPAAGHHHHHHPQSSSAASKDGPGESHGSGHTVEEASSSSTSSDHPAAASSDDIQVETDKDTEYSNYYPYETADIVDAGE